MKTTVDYALMRGFFPRTSDASRSCLCLAASVG